MILNLTGKNQDQISLRAFQEMAADKGMTYYKTHHRLAVVILTARFIHGRFFMLFNFVQATEPTESLLPV